MTDDSFTREHGVELLFEQVNEHLRSTEAKSVELTVGYFGVVAIALSILGAASHGLGKPSVGHLAAYGVLVVMGCLSFHIQTAFRGWKVHYVHYLRKYIAFYGVEPGLLPDFLAPAEARSQRIRRPSADRGLTLLSGLVTAGTVVLFVRQWLDLWSNAAIHVAFGFGTALAVVFLAGDALRHTITFRCRQARLEAGSGAVEPAQPR